MIFTLCSKVVKSKFEVIVKEKTQSRNSSKLYLSKCSYLYWIKGAIKIKFGSNNIIIKHEHLLVRHRADFVIWIVVGFLTQMTHHWDREQISASLLTKSFNKLLHTVWDLLREEECFFFFFKNTDVLREPGQRATSYISLKNTIFCVLVTCMMGGLNWLTAQPGNSTQSLNYILPSLIVGFIMQFDFKLKGRGNR